MTVAYSPFIIIAAFVFPPLLLILVPVAIGVALGLALSHREMRAARQWAKGERNTTQVAPSWQGVNFTADQAARVRQEWRLAFCDVSGLPFSTGPVEIVHQANGITAFRCPACGQTHNDSPTGPTPGRKTGYLLLPPERTRPGPEPHS